VFPASGNGVATICVIHDRDAIFSEEVDEELASWFCVRALRTPPQSSPAEKRFASSWWPL
jgi:hypothetical protein